MWPFNNHKHTKKDCEITVIEETNVVIIEGDHYKKWNPEKEELEIIEHLVKIIERLTQPQKQRTRLVLQTILQNNTIVQIMSLKLNANQFSLDVLSLIDSDTGAAVAATFANQKYESSDPNVFTSVQDATDPNTTKDTAVGAGTANLNVSADATYTDANTGQSVTKSLSLVVDVTVIAIVAGENVSLVLTQGAPQLQ